jgi:methionyl-tRNA synthetase
VARINADLANALGNLAQRTLSFIYKNCGGVIPVPGALTAGDQKMLHQAGPDLMAAVRTRMDEYLIHRALEDINTAVFAANAYIDTQAPWALKKTDPARMSTVLYVLAEVIRCIAIIMQPVTPASAGKMLDQIGVGPDARTFEHIVKTLKGGEKINEPKGVFPRIADDKAA